MLCVLQGAPKEDPYDDDDDNTDLASGSQDIDSGMYISQLKGRMILRCVAKAISYKCPYVIAIVVPYQIYTVV